MAVSQNLRGIGAMLIAAAAFVSNDTCMKLALEDAPPFQVLIMRGAAACLWCVPVLVAMVDGLDGKALRTLHDSVKSRQGDGVIVLTSSDGEKISLIASVAAAHTSRIKAGEVISHLAAQLGGKGGGKADSAQGGAPMGPQYQPAMQALPAWIAAKLATTA